MGDAPIDPRVLAAQKKHAAAKRDEAAASYELLDTYGEVLREHAVNPSNTVVPGTWDCEKSPVGKCVYDFFEDPCRDSCIFCHDPEERK